MIPGVFFDLSQGCERLFVLLAIELELGLRQQHGVGCLGCLLECHAQPLVAAVVFPLQMGGARSLQVVE